jgi:hypothetical protein
MLIPFGILSAAGAGVGVAGDYELIETSILTSSASSVTFSNLGTYSSTYKHLQIRLAVRTSNAGTGFVVGRFNSDGGSNYRAHWIRGNGSDVGSSESGLATRFYASRFDAATNVFCPGVIDILDAYSTTKNKTTRTFTGNHGTSPNEIYLFSGLWMNTASITSITLLPDGGSGTLSAGSRFSLYGIKG